MAALRRFYVQSGFQFCQVESAFSGARVIFDAVRGRAIKGGGGCLLFILFFLVLRLKLSGGLAWKVGVGLFGGVPRRLGGASLICKLVLLS